MGNYGNIVKTEQIRKKVVEGDFASAQTILDAIDLKKVKNMSDLNLFAEVFMENERYDESVELYLKIYEKCKSRKATAQMVKILIKKGDISEAEEYLQEYISISPDDYDSFVFRYKIAKMKGASYEQLIELLKGLKKVEYTEKWSYELAKVYYKADMEAECIRECSDIILWFGEGTYVEKAKILRSYFTGETDKYKILEELKRRSEGLNEEDNNQDDNDDSDSSEGAHQNNLEDDICSSANFNEENGTQELADGLMKDVQNIMSYRQDEMQPEEEEQLVQEDQLVEVEQPEEEKQFAEHNQLEEEQPVQENPQEYGLNEQFVQKVFGQNTGKSLVEEDVILSNISKELQINPDELFGDFLQVDTVKKQLVRGLEIIMQDSTQPVLMIITGAKGSERSALAKDMAFIINKAGKIQSSKIAKISAGKLNKVDIDSKRELLKGCCLVVDYASELKQATIDKLLILVKSMQGDIAVIFEEDEKNIGKLEKEYPGLMEDFKIHIDLNQ